MHGDDDTTTPEDDGTGREHVGTAHQGYDEKQPATSGSAHQEGVVDAPRTGDAHQGEQDEPTSGSAMQERDADDG